MIAVWLALQTAAAITAYTLLALLLWRKFSRTHTEPEWLAYLLVAVHASLFWTVAGWFRWSGVHVPTLFLSMWSTFVQVHILSTLIGLKIADSLVRRRHG